MANRSVTTHHFRSISKDGLDSSALTHPFKKLFGAANKTEQANVVQKERVEAGVIL